MNISKALSEANVGFVYDKIKIEAAYSNGTIKIVSFIPYRIQRLFNNEDMMATSETEDENRGSYKFSESIEGFINYLYTTISKYAGSSKVDRESFDKLGEELNEIVPKDSFRNINITTDTLTYNYKNKLKDYATNQQPNWDYETYVVFKSGEKLIYIEGIRRLNKSLYRRNTNEREFIKPDKRLFSDPKWNTKIKRTAVPQ